MIIRPEAERDIVDAVGWYENQRRGLGDRFQKSLGRVLSQIDALPEMHRVVAKDVRRALTQPFPFAVYYRIWEGDVVVLAVLHSRRHPEHWKARI